MRGNIARKLLLVEDNPGDARLLREMINEEKFHTTELTLVTSMRDAERHLANNVVDMILLDVGLPDAQGLGAVQRARAAAPHVALVVLTGMEDESLALGALQEGAQDYLIKGQIEAPGLLRALRYSAERQHMEDALVVATELTRKSEEEYRLLFEANPNPMWVLDVETLRFLTVNSAASACYGFSTQEFLAMTVDDIEPEGELDHLAFPVENEPNHFQPPVPRKHKKKDGSLVEVEITSRLTTFDGRPANLVLVQDVTLRKNLEETLRRRQKVEAVALLASGIAHDFNNLLGIIVGCTELAALHLEEGSPAASKLMDVQSAAQRAARLTRQLMLFSRQEVTEARIIDLNESVAASERFLRRVIGEDILFECAFDEHSLNIKIDPSHLEQILLNLVVNARDAMPKGGRIRIATTLADSTTVIKNNGAPRNGSFALLTFSDTGHGMDSATRDRVFEPFFTTKEKGKGTGLGLATCDGIVKEAGGYIDVSSEVGVGTTFRILFPSTSGPATTLSQVEKPALLAHGETILVTEDEPDLREIVVESLRGNGYNVLSSDSGAATIAMLDQNHGAIELLLTDVIMPGMSGAELSLHVTQKYPGISILLMTGYSDDELRRHELPRTARVIQKPFTRLNLLQKVRMMLDAARPLPKKYKILVAEDDSTYRGLMSEVLKNAGFEVRCVEDGTRALLQGLGESFDLAILDIEMPRTNGIAVCKNLKSDPSTALIPVLLVSGIATSDRRDMATAVGANAFLCKPFGSDELLSCVKALLFGTASPAAHSLAPTQSATRLAM
jgi:PAS domain S-box-containing protein